MRKSDGAFLSTALALTLGACSQNAESPAERAANSLGSARVAMVNDQPVAESVLRVYTLATERKNLEELAPADRERLLNDVIGLTLLDQQAEKDGLASSRTLAAQVELQRLQLVARAMATQHLEQNPPTETEIQQVYDENLARLSGEQYKARHILVETRAEAEDVIAQLRNGEAFVTLAEQRADGPTGPNGGALDWFTAESMPESFANAVRSMAVGSYSTEPVQTEFGFHIILLEETRRQEPPPLAQIRNELVSVAERKRLDDYIKTLRAGATVSVEE